MKCPGVPHRGHASSDWNCPYERDEKPMKTLDELIAEFGAEALRKHQNGTVGIYTFDALFARFVNELFDNELMLPREVIAALIKSGNLEVK